MPQEEMLIAIKEIRKLLHLDSKNKMASRGEILDEETKKLMLAVLKNMFLKLA